MPSATQTRRCPGRPSCPRVYIDQKLCGQNLAYPTQSQKSDQSHLAKCHTTVIASPRPRSIVTMAAWPHINIGCLAVSSKLLTVAPLKQEFPVPTIYEVRNRVRDGVVSGTRRHAIHSKLYPIMATSGIPGSLRKS